MNSTDLGEARRQITDIKDPFNQRSMKAVHIHAYQSFFNNTWTYTASVEFKNGKTEGKQNFEGANIGEVLIKVEAFIKELEE